MAINNPLIPGDPYSYDLKWVVEELKHAIELYTPISQEVQDLYDFVHGYFESTTFEGQLDVALRQLASDGTLASILQPMFDEYKIDIDDEIENMLGRLEQQDDDIDVLVARMNSFASLPPGSTSGNAELLDIRVGYDAKTWPSAGDAVRGQAGKLASALTNEAEHGIGMLSYDLLQDGTVDAAPIYINNLVDTSGNVGAASNIRVTTKNLIYVPKDAHLTYQSSQNYAISLHEFDAEKNYLGLYTYGQLQPTAVYFRPLFSFSDNSNIDKDDVAQYVRFIITADSINQRIVNAVDNYENYANMTFVTKHTGKNLLDRSAAVVGYLKNDGTIQSTATQYRTSDFIPVTNGQSVVISPRARIFAFFDANKQMVAGSYMNTETANYTATASADGYFRFSYYVADLDIMAEIGSTPSSFAPFTKYIESNVSINNLENVSGVIFGDSIMHGAGNPDTDEPDGYEGIGDILNEKYGMTFADYCESGACVEYVAGRPANPVYQQILNAINDGITPDLIILDGLSNDIVVGTLGTLDNDYDYITGGYNDFTKALEYCFGTLRANFPNTPILYVIPHSSVGRTYATELQFGDRAREICKKWSVPIADVYKDGNLNSHIDEQLQAFTNYPAETTGTHPNRAGYEYAYLPLIMAWIESVYTKIKRN